MRIRIAIALTLLATLVAGVGPSPAEAAGSFPCFAKVDDDGRVSIGLPEVTSFSPRGYIVERSRNGGPFWWRYRGANESFKDTMPSGSTYEYRIKTTGADQAIGFCGVADLTAGAAVPQVASCFVPTKSSSPDAVNVHVSSDLDYVSLQKKWVLYRSVNDGPLYWRGVYTEAWVGGFPSFWDEVKLGQSVDYFIVSVNPDGRRSEPFPCGSFDHQMQDPAPAQACGQNAGDPIGFHLPSLRIRNAAWTTGVAIYRSIDGGPAYWQTRAELSFFKDYWYWVDESLTADEDRKFEYWIEQIGYNGRRGERIYCGEMVFPEPR